MASHSHQGHGHSPGHDLHLSGPEWLPVALAILLGTAALVAGLIAWRAAGHSGEAQKEFTLSTQAVISERSLFVAYEDAVAQHDRVRAADDQGLMDPATLRAINWWLAQPRDAR